VDAPACYEADERPPLPHRPWLALNMVTSLDGATAVAQASAGLSGPADKAIFFALRAVADVILVGAGTARDEDYGPPRVAAALQAGRRARGQSDRPRLAVVSSRLDLDPGARMFGDPGLRPIILTVADAPADRRAALEPVADLVEAGVGQLDAGAMLDALHALGTGVVVCEGGPVLNGHLLVADVVDELCLTTAPILAGGPSTRLVVGPAVDPARGMRLDRLLEEDGILFHRYLRER
jgi:riboflavin-specific deaminase-like protein